MGRYSDLSDEALAAKITTFTEKLEEVAIGGDVAVIVSDGRRMELVRGNTGAAERILEMLLDEREKRANGGRLPGRALGMRFLTR